MKPITDLLRNYNNDLEAYLKDNTPDQSMLFEVVTTNNKSAYNLLMSKIEVNEKEALFKKALEYSNIDFAFDIFKRFKDDFSVTQDLTYKNIETEDDNVRRLNNADILDDNNILPRHYQDIEYATNKELFAAMLLNESLRVNGHYEDNLKVLDYLLTNKNEFNIKDETIVQYFVEGYTMTQFDEDANLRPELHQFTKIVQLLLDNKVSFESDTQGYLVQIAGHNINIANYSREVINKDLINNIISNGSNIEQYKARLDNKNNWLSSSQDENFVDYYDRDQNYIYDISHKFDSRNNDLYLKHVTNLTGHIFNEEKQNISVETEPVLEEVKATIETSTESPVVVNNISDNVTHINNSIEQEKPEVKNNPSTLGKLINSLRARFTKTEDNKNSMKNN